MRRGTESQTPKRQSNALLTSRRIADIRNLVALQSNECSIFLGDDGEDCEKVTVEIKPAIDLFIDEPVCFEIRIPVNYPTEGPEVFCRTDVTKYKEVTEVNPHSGETKVSLLEPGEAGWSRVYNLAIVYYSIRLLFKERLYRWNHGKVIRKHAAWTNGASGASAKAQNSNPIPVPLQPSRLGTMYQLCAAHHGEQGIRRTMEDAFCIELNLTIKRQVGKDCKQVGIICLMDGHGGHICADYSSQHLPQLVCNHLSEGLGWRQALWQSIQDTDDHFRKEYDSADRVGCTCLALLFDGKRCCYLGNLGDCRAVLCRGGRAVDLTKDTRADRPDEIARISAAGGFVTNGRVNGKLAVSRALGDFMYKQGHHCSRLVGSVTVVSAEPELSEVELNEEDQFIIIACDGLWDVMSSEEAVTFVFNRMDEGLSIKEIAEAIVNNAIQELDSTDNVSALIIQISSNEYNTPTNKSSMNSSIDSLLNSPTLNGLLASSDEKEMIRLDSFEDEVAPSKSKEKGNDKESGEIKNNSSFNSSDVYRKEPAKAETKVKSIDDLDDEELFDYLLNEKNFTS